VPGRDRLAELEFFGEFFLALQAVLAERGQRPGGAAELDDQQTLF
jgi:hypothetical protein